MTLVQLGEQVAMQLASFADAARCREMEPASFHVGERQYKALAAWAETVMDLTGSQLTIDGIPIWRDLRDHHIELECIRGRKTDQLEACLRA